MWKNPDIDPSAFIAPSADIYGDVSIAENCSIWFHATVRAGAGSVSIGAGTNVQDNCVIHVDRGYSVTVGKNVTIGHSAIVDRKSTRLNSSHPLSSRMPSSA